MVKVYLNPGKLDEKLSAIDKFRESVTNAYNAIKNYYTNDPIRGDLDSCLAKFASTGDDLIIRAGEIRKIKTNIEQLNSSGIATLDADGRINVEVPDDSVDNPKKFEKWSQGVLDANDLRSGKKSLPSGRSFDEVMKSMEANKEDPTYANSVIDRIGPENLTKIGDKNPNNNREAPIIGEILATASRTWDEEKSKRNADLIIGSVDDENEWDRIPILNKMIGGHDADRDGVSDLKFGANFLASMGHAAEKLPYQKINDTKNPELGGPGEYNKGRYYPLESYDPLSGVIEAMTNSGEASAMFFGTKGVNAREDDIERTRMLAERYPFGDNKWTNNLAIISDKMSELGLINTTEASSEQIKLADQAALGTSVILNTLGESDVNLSGTSLNHIGNALKNYAAGVDNSIRNAGNVSGDTAVTYLSGKIPNGAGGFTTSYTEDYWGDGLATQANFSDAALSNLTGQLGLTEHGLDGLQLELGYIADRRISYAANSAGPEGNKSSALETAISNYRKAEGFIAGAISKEGVDRGINADNQVNAWISGISGVTGFIPIPGMSEAGKSLEHIFKAGVSYMAARGEKEGMNALEERFANNQREAEVTAGDLVGDKRQVITNDIMKKLIMHGAVTKEKLSEWGGKDETILNPDVILNYDNLSKAESGVDEEKLKEQYGSGEELEAKKKEAEEDRKQIQESIRNAFSNMSARISEFTDEWVARSYKEGTDTEYDDGIDRARGYTNNKGDYVAPTKFKK